MNWLLTSLLCALAIEVALRLPLGKVVSGLAKTSNRALVVVRTTGISDHWKEKAMAAYARETFFLTMKLAFFLAVILTIAVIAAAAIETIHEDFIFFILSVRGILFGILFSVLYVGARKVFSRG